MHCKEAAACPSAIATWYRPLLGQRGQIPGLHGSQKVRSSRPHTLITDVYAFATLVQGLLSQEALPVCGRSSVLLWHASLAGTMHIAHSAAALCGVPDSAYRAAGGGQIKLRLEKADVSHYRKAVERPLIHVSLLDAQGRPVEASLVTPPCVFDAPTGNIVSSHTISLRTKAENIPEGGVCPC